MLTNGLQQRRALHKQKPWDSVHNLGTDLLFKLIPLYSETIVFQGKGGFYLSYCHGPEIPHLVLIFTTLPLKNVLL